MSTDKKLINRLRAEQEEQAAGIKPQQVVTGEDGATGHDYVADPVSASKNFDQKIYFMPESYNALRRELHDNWPNLWIRVQWFMAHNAQQFVNEMNDALDCKIQFDTAKVESICAEFLNKLRALRGLSKL